MKTLLSPLQAVPRREARRTRRVSARRRRGMIYIAVLGAGMIVMTLAGGALLVGRTRARVVDGTVQMSNARLAATSGLELARLWIDQDTAWRTNRTNGTWATNLAVGPGTVTISVVDPLDGNLANRPHDPVVITATGKSGLATQILQTTLVASLTPLSALACAIHSTDKTDITTKTLVLGTGIASSNSNVKYKDGIVEGNVDAVSVTSGGIVTGTVTSGTAAKGMPASTVPEMYASLGTTISAVTLLDKRVLGPGLNPFGTANADGVYVIRSSSTVTLRNTHVTGTLVIFAPSVILDTAVLIEPYRADYPSLIVSGDLTAQIDSTAAIVESALGIVFNPLNTVITGSAAGTYPNEVRGLVHVTGDLTLNSTATFRGTILAGGQATVKQDTKIVYDPTLFTSPPQGYTSRVRMVVQANSTKQIVN